MYTLITSNISSAYSIFVSTFYSTRDSLEDSYRKTTLETFCDSLIRERDNLFHLGVINTTGTSNKPLVAHHKDKYKHPKKQHPHNKNKNKGPKLS
jgi:hypothetical protein